MSGGSGPSIHQVLPPVEGQAIHQRLVYSIIYSVGVNKDGGSIQSPETYLNEFQLNYRKKLTIGASELLPRLFD